MKQRNVSDFLFHFTVQGNMGIDYVFNNLDHKNVI